MIIFISITSGTDKQSRKDTGTVKTHMGKRYPDSTQFTVYRGRVLVGQNMFTTADQEWSGQEETVYKNTWLKPCILLEPA